MIFRDKSNPRSLHYLARLAEAQARSFHGLTAIGCGTKRLTKSLCVK